jgi:regulator of nucleoside diphosphate kinase
MRAREAPHSHPAIVLGSLDHERLTAFANALAERIPDLADDLLTELERATVVPSDAIPAGVVRMGSTVTFRAGSGATRRVRLVYPAEADLSVGRISIATSVGVALIGLSADQEFTWVARDGRSHTLTVLAVEQTQEEAVPA